MLGAHSSPDKPIHQLVGTQRVSDIGAAQPSPSKPSFPVQSSSGNWVYWENVSAQRAPLLSFYTHSHQPSSFSSEEKLFQETRSPI